MQSEQFGYHGVARQRYHQLVGTALKVALAAHLLVLPIFWLMGAHFLALYNVLSVFVFSLCIWLRKQGYILPVVVLAYSEVITHAVLASWHLGLDAGYHFYVPMLAMLVLMNLSERLWTKIYKIALLVTAYFTIILVFQGREPVIQLSEQNTLLLYNGNQISIMLIVAYLIYFYSRVVQVTEEQLYSMATRDQLTGLYNRRYVDDFAAHYFSSRSALKKPLSLLIIDVDYFKSVNDTYGHSIGDKVLETLAEQLTVCTRADDIAGRWGGEEFIILLPDTFLNDAAEIAQRIVLTMANSSTETGTGPVQVTVSIGVVEKLGHESFDQLTVRADQALYQAKSSGRNRYVIA